jgi:hypothetical protein
MSINVLSNSNSLLKTYFLLKSSNSNLIMVGSMSQINSNNSSPKMASCTDSLAHTHHNKMELQKENTDMLWK